LKQLVARFMMKMCYADTLLAYFREFRDSSKLADDGLMQQIISVLALPPNESCHTCTPQSILLSFIGGNND